VALPLFYFTYSLFGVKFICHEKSESTLLLAFNVPILQSCCQEKPEAILILVPFQENISLSPSLLLFLSSLSPSLFPLSLC
jgi:hypothetical protein